MTVSATLARVRAARDLYRDHGTIKTQFLLGLLNEVEAALSLRDHVYGEKWVASTAISTAPVIKPAGIEKAERENLRVRNERDAQRRRAETAERRLAERAATMKIHGISLAVAKALVELFGDDETDMTVEFIVDGHSGAGFYAWCTEYPEDGSNFLGPASEFSYLSAHSPAQRERRNGSG